MIYTKWSIRDTTKLHKILQDNPYTTIDDLSVIMGFTVVTIHKKLKQFRYKKGWVRQNYEHKS